MAEKVVNVTKSFNLPSPLLPPWDGVVVDDDTTMMFGEDVGVKTASGVAVMHMQERQQLLLTAHYHCREDSLEPVSREVVAGTGGAVVAGTGGAVVAGSGGAVVAGTGGVVVAGTGGVVITTDTKEESNIHMKNLEDISKFSRCDHTFSTLF